MAVLLPPGQNGSNAGPQASIIDRPEAIMVSIEIVPSPLDQQQQDHYYNHRKQPKISLVV